MGKLFITCVPSTIRRAFVSIEVHMYHIIATTLALQVYY